MGSEEMRKTTDFFLEHQELLGFDMAGAETNVLQHAECFQRVRDAGGRITACQRDLVEGVPENALNAVEVLGAERIAMGFKS